MMPWVILLIILIFSILVLIHEWGHFILAKRNGVTVEEFALFFWPTIFKHRTKAGWWFKINLLPLGGYVKLKGEHDADTGKGTFGAASLLAKSKIMAAGVAINILAGMVLLMIVAWVGMPQLVPNQFTVKSDTKVTKSEVILSYIEPNSPASHAGLKAGDQITQVGTQQVTTPDQLKAATKQYGGQDVTVHYVRQGQPHAVHAKLLTSAAVAASQKSNNPKGQLGVIPENFSLQRSTWSAPIVAVGFAGQFTVLTLQGLGHALAGLGSATAGIVTGNSHARNNGASSAANQVTGPIGIYFILQRGTLLGYQFVLFITAIISLSLGIINLLPIPGLDGGRLWLTLFSRGVLKKPIPPGREELINATGIAFLLGLMVLVTFVDVHRFF